MHDIISVLYEHYTQYRGVSIDSRRVQINDLFFALKGDNFDGNIFAHDALAKGAAWVVIDEEQYRRDERYIVVGDVLKTLQALAQHHRKRLDIPVIGITGSSGKTTTKELVSAVLARKYVTVATKGNLNNHIGVPLTILGAYGGVEMAVVEMGANHVGEIAQLCEIAMPTHGLITNIGHVHIEGFGSFEGVVKGKCELYDFLYKTGGEVFVNSADPLLLASVEQFPKVMTYPQVGDFYHCELVEQDPFVVCRDEYGTLYSSLLGRHHFYNMAAALCVGKYFGVEGKAAHEAIEAYEPSNNRSQILKKGSNTILLDAYNANPDSMRGAIQALGVLPARDKVLILGGMRELGNESRSAHHELVQLTANPRYKMVLLCGPEMQAAKEANPAALYFPNKEELASFLEKQRFEDTALLIKGSRFFALETLQESIF